MLLGVCGLGFGLVIIGVVVGLFLGYLLVCKVVDV